MYTTVTMKCVLNTRPYVTSGISNSSPAHIGEVSNKGIELALRWDDKITDYFSYWVGGTNNRPVKFEKVGVALWYLMKSRSKLCGVSYS
jgi:hypothetical protein